MTMMVRCSHCDQVMTIAPRKPGSRVTCPACGGSVTVPAPEAGRAAAPVPQPAAVAGAVVPMLPTSPVQISRRRETPEASRQAPAASPTQSPAAPPRRPAETNRTAGPDVADLPHHAVHEARQAGRSNWIALPLSALILSLVFALAALIVAFLAGFLFGRHGF